MEISKIIQREGRHFIDQGCQITKFGEGEGGDVAIHFFYKQPVYKQLTLR